MQVNLGKLLTGLGSGDLLHPQNSVLGATVSRAALYDRVFKKGRLKKDIRSRSL